jgi:hypothetical protein
MGIFKIEMDKLKRLFNWLITSLLIGYVLFSVLLTVERYFYYFPNADVGPPLSLTHERQFKVFRGDDSFPSSITTTNLNSREIIMNVFFWIILVSLILLKRPLSLLNSFILSFSLIAISSLILLFTSLILSAV